MPDTLPTDFDASRRLQNFSSRDQHYVQEMDRRTNGEYSKYRDNYERISKELKVVGYPIHIDIENVFACNLKCGHCARQYADIPNSRLMDDRLYRDIIDQAVSIGTKAIAFTNWGEMLMDKRVYDKIKYARDRGILDIRTHSNGIILNEESADKLVTSGVTWINISLDAATAETYAKVRGGDFEKAQAAIGYLVNAKLRHNTHVPKLRVSFVKQKQNEHEAQMFIEKFNGIADVTIQDFRNSMGLMTEDQAKQYYPSDTWIDPDASQCSQPFERLFVRYDGTVVACCSDIESKIVYGTLKKNTLKEIYNSAVPTELRRQHFHKCPPELCKFCLTH